MISRLLKCYTISSLQRSANSDSAVSYVKI